MESPKHQREYIKGKKSGKIQQIQHNENVIITLRPFNDYIDNITVKCCDFTTALRCFDELLNELPAEISFFVPEKYHAAIIGRGGVNIQQICHEYGVFIQFGKEANENMLVNRYDNVYIKTPTKNRHRLLDAKTKVLQLSPQPI